MARTTEELPSLPAVLDFQNSFDFMDFGLQFNHRLNTLPNPE